MNTENEEEYLGNVFGWKVSFIGLALIVVMFSFMVFNHMTGRIDMRTGEPFVDSLTEQVDTLKIPQ